VSPGSRAHDQEDAVQWWRNTVRNGRPSKSVAESATLFAEEAERILGFDKQTISRWAKKLADRAQSDLGKRST